MQPSSRKVVTRTPSRTVRIINLPDLLTHPVEAESSLEADFIRRAAFFPNIKDLIHQPFNAPISPRGYTPDFLTTLNCEKPAVVEVKPISKLGKYLDLFDKAADYFSQKNFDFFVVTDEHLRKDEIHTRALLLRRYAKAIFYKQECLKVTGILDTYSEGLPLGTLIRKAKVSAEVVYHLIARRTLTTGPFLRVDPSCRVMLSAHVKNKFSFSCWLQIRPWGTEKTSSSDKGA